MFLTPVRLLDGPIRVEFPQLWQAAQDINVAMTTMNNMLSDLETSLESKMNDPSGGWDGAARGAYRSEKIRWNAAADEIERLLGSVSRAVESSNERYAANEMKQVNRYGGGV